MGNSLKRDNIELKTQQILVKTENFIHNNLHQTLLVTKVVLIVLTVVWGLFSLIVYILEKTRFKNSETFKKDKKALTIFSSILFYLILFFIVILSIVIMIVTRKTRNHILNKAKQEFKQLIYKISPKNYTKINNKLQNESKITMNENQLIYVLSMNWWMIFYLILVCLLVLYAKITRNPAAVFNLF